MQRQSLAALPSSMMDETASHLSVYSLGHVQSISPIVVINSSSMINTTIICQIFRNIRFYRVNTPFVMWTKMAERLANGGILMASSGIMPAVINARSTKAVGANSTGIASTH
jgi:hypothetical protein